MIYPEINAYLDQLPAIRPEAERLKKWEHLANSLKNASYKGAVNFICTHNARRSVLSQSLAATLAYKYGFSGLVFWSGGAEVTRVHPSTIATLQHIGFHKMNEQEGANPIYKMNYSDELPPLHLFSKTFDDVSSPAPYHAVLVCSKGDAACPFIPGVASRTLIPFEDPGAYDGTPKEEEAYQESAAQIGGELRYFFEHVLSDARKQ